MTQDKLANIYVIHHIPSIEIESDIFSHIYVKKGIVPDSPNILTSDTKDNIANENNLYAEYSTFYWAWKNQPKCKYTGFFQFRRYISFNDKVTNQVDTKSAISHYGWDKNTLESLLENYDLILPTPFYFSWATVRNQYFQCHGHIYLSTALDIIAHKYPDYIQDCNIALERQSGFYCNMFIMRTDLFNIYMEWIMDIFNELKIRLNPPNTVKEFAYLGERLFNCFVQHISRIYDLRIKINPWIYVDTSKNEVYDFQVN